MNAIGKVVLLLIVAAGLEVMSVYSALANCGVPITVDLYAQGSQTVLGAAGNSCYNDAQAICEQEAQQRFDIVSKRCERRCQQFGCQSNPNSPHTVYTPCGSAFDTYNGGTFNVCSTNYWSQFLCYCI